MEQKNYSKFKKEKYEENRKKICKINIFFLRKKKLVLSYNSTAQKVMCMCRFDVILPKKKFYVLKYFFMFLYKVSVVLFFVLKVLFFVYIKKVFSSENEKIS